MGADLVKSPDVLVPAYDDAQGVTADFNKNVLRVLNRELGADLRPGRLRAPFRVERAGGADRDAAALPRAQTVALPALEMNAEFEEGEEVLTEIAVKFRRSVAHGRTRPRGT